MVVKYDYYDTRLHKYSSSVMDVHSSQDILGSTQSAVAYKYPERKVYAAQLRPSSGLKIYITPSPHDRFTRFRCCPRITVHKGYLVLTTDKGTVVCYNPYTGAVYRTTTEYSPALIRMVHRFFDVLGVPPPVKFSATWEEWKAVPFNNSYPKW